MTHDLRLCPNCERPRSRLTQVQLDDADAHLTGSVTPAQLYVCDACHTAYSLLDPSLRGWCWYGVVLGLAFIAFGGWLWSMQAAEGLLMLFFASLAALGSAVSLARDDRLRRETELGEAITPFDATEPSLG